MALPATSGASKAPRSSAGAISFMARQLHLKRLPVRRYPREYTVVIPFECGQRDIHQLRNQIWAAWLTYTGLRAEFGLAVWALEAFTRPALEFLVEVQSAGELIQQRSAWETRKSLSGLQFFELFAEVQFLFACREARCNLLQVSHTCVKLGVTGWLGVGSLSVRLGVIQLQQVTDLVGGRKGEAEEAKEQGY